MNEQIQKLDVIRSRCKTASKVTKVLQIIAIIGIVGSLVGLIFSFAMKDTINAEIAKQVANGTATVDSFKLEGGIIKLAINYDEMYNRNDYATPLGINCTIAAVLTTISAYLIGLFKKIFDNLIKEDNPFSDSIMKSLKICFIVLTVILLAFTGIGPGVICGLLCWCIYSILEYGKALQVEVDETL